MIQSTVQRLRIKIRRNRLVLFALLIYILYELASKETQLGNLSYLKTTPRRIDIDRRPIFTNRTEIAEEIERILFETLKKEKGRGCDLPKLNPFDRTMRQKKMAKIRCRDKNWVTCELSQCSVKQEILDKIDSIVCIYNDIIHVSDHEHLIGPSNLVMGKNSYNLSKSDHVKINCTGRPNHNYYTYPSTWSGHGVGFRPVQRKTFPSSRNSYNVMILVLDSTSKNAFIRNLHKSYKVLVDELGATVLNGYNVLGDGTTSALIPLLTGRNELELTDIRRHVENTNYMNEWPFIFYALKKDGFRTAYFEDMPNSESFTYRLKGFKDQPTDHYFRSFLLEEANTTDRRYAKNDKKYCIGDTPQYKVMLDISEQFFKLDGKKFCFTFISDIANDDYRVINDEDVVTFLRSFKEQGRLNDTMLIVMGDHGKRLNTFQGKLEERLPLMAIVLPDELKKESYPEEGQLVLEDNKDVLVTPYDIHTTLLHFVGLTGQLNPFVVKGADFKRGLSLFEPIPKNRTCSEAGIESQWCSCMVWVNVAKDELLYRKIAEKVVEYVNNLTQPLRYMCKNRTLKSIRWMQKRSPNNNVLAFWRSQDQDGYVGEFQNSTVTKVTAHKQDYKLALSLNPDGAAYEVHLKYYTRKYKEIIVREIKRIE